MAFVAPQIPFHHSQDREFKSALDLFNQAVKLESENAAKQFERSRQYTTLVVTLGYAGIFGIWNFCTTVVPPSVNAVVGVLVGISLSMFVIFEILKMFTMQKIALRQLNVINLRPDVHDLNGLIRFSEEHRRRQEAVALENFDASKRMQAIWPYFFYPTVILGFGGMFLLLYNLLAHITKLVPFFPA